MKCVVWDLDHTLWDGVLLEGFGVTVKDNVSEIIRTLDERGILQSVASKNNHADAEQKLRDLGLYEYFLYPQINWNNKSDSIGTIAKSLNISLDSIAFIDDQPFELDEVQFVHPDVFCILAEGLDGLLDLPELHPVFITEDSKIRRKMYQDDIERKLVEERFEGAQEDFLASLDMEFTISSATETDLQRVEELTVRTHQLNTTGYTYSYEELREFIKSDSHRLIISGLSDKYGTYGKIGIVLLECQDKVWNIKLLLMSCRVMSRGVGSIMLTYLMQEAANAGVKLRAEFISNDRNRPMLITYKFAGFQEVEQQGNCTIMERNTDQIPQLPDYVSIIIND
ncbi:HAD-IIIC family phosphatase [Paenibacillus sp. FSL R7-277]|uniref:HAD-IIIC family phosphatase n=2 Tax=Paenibacillus TaxID=44249 RepID=UPI001F418D49|nr:HAD-IIIC family phosphatase [Paenibacillus sp. FSL R7-277]